MKTSLRLLLALLVLPAAALLAGEQSAGKSKNCGCSCCKGKETCCCNTESSAADAKPDAKRYPLKGVIVDILAEKSALLVKHEEIPGYMKAMTMLLKVDAATLQAAAKGRAITATLVEKDDGFWLEDVKPAR